MNLCPKCNNELVIIDNGRDHIVKCPKCDFEIVTSNNSRMDFDSNIYEIYIEAGNNQSVENIRFISKLTGCNFIESRKVLTSGTLIKKGYAIEVIRVRDCLHERDIKYRIVPVFPY